MRSRLLTIVAVIGFLAPLTGIAQSYMTPEQFLEQNDQEFLIPGGHRGAQWRADLEAELSRDRHPTIVREPWDPVQDDGLPPPVALEEEEFSDYEDLSPVEPIQPYGNLDPVTARILARLAQQNSLLTSTLQSTAGANGAPLAGTGPASVIAVLAMVVAIVWTLRRARILERFVQEF
ncbi:MAG: hypothetical protein HOO67_01325 [Candidatus Peribacteraceae bacterium]|nr:hypothetical protein [Candidatus Peribacteraceae bacterium]